jgi:hypothetical protein
MHSFFLTAPAAARRPFPRKPVPAESVPETACLVQMTVDTRSLTLLRQAVMRVCGDALEFMRIEACDHGRRMRVCLCVGRCVASRLMEEVMRLLPAAEFGRVGPAAPRHFHKAARAHGSDEGARA